MGTEKSGEQAIFEATIARDGAPPAGLTARQTEILVDTVANPEAAMQELEKTHPELVREIRERQYDVAEKRRRANSNPDILNLRIR